MEEPQNVIPAAPFGDEDIALQALDRIAGGGVAVIERSLGELQTLGIRAADELFQTVLIEAIFQMLERLEVDPADALVQRLALGFDPVVAAAASDLLLQANFADGEVRTSDLGDGTILLLAGLQAAANRRADAIDMLRQAEIRRPSPGFRRAAIQLLFLLQQDVDGVVQLLFERVLDGLDHPEIWSVLPVVVGRFPDLSAKLAGMLDDELGFYTELWAVLHALCVAAAGDAGRGLALIEPIATAHSQSTMVQGAVFHIKSLLDPGNMLYDLSDRFCSTPFETLDILDGKSHLCCASWLPESVGDLTETPWRDVWNSDAAQSVRGSILDGSFRFCNKIACPKIARGDLPTKAKAAAESRRWREVIGGFQTRLAAGPHRVNLAYDQTCNLSCPSCRTGKVAADSVTRARYDRLQEDQVLPLLRTAGLVFVTGSGDPFASKNFRTLLDRLGPEDYPDLRIQLMTNGMLFTPREWERFPALHGRTAFLRISLDAATGPTHELLRRGARWPVMEENLAFAQRLREEGLIDRLEFAFTVQTENYHEMSPAIDLAHHYGADSVAFGRLTNWGTFTPAQYAAKAVFMPSHPRHGHFLELMQDARLRDPVAALNDLSEYVR